MTTQSATITKTINAPIARIYQAHIDSTDLIRWQSAGSGWFIIHATTNPVVGGQFNYGYASPNAQNDFDFVGTYTEIIPNERLTYSIADGRTVTTLFEIISDNETLVSTTFGIENENTLELQKAGWTNILNNLADYVERVANPDNRPIRQSVVIEATPEKVWKVLLDHETYRQWTTALCEGADYVGEMKQDGQVRFTSPKGDGLISNIVVYSPARCVAFRHVGCTKDGIEDFDSLEMQAQQGFREEYLLTKTASGTILGIYIDVTAKEYSAMDEMWSKALQTVKELSEK